MTAPDSRNPHYPLAKPNLSEPRYAVAAETDSSAPGYWLERDGRQLLAGPRDELEHFAEVMNLTDPPDWRVGAVLRSLICGTRGSIFTTGEYLRRLGRSAAA